MGIWDRYRLRLRRKRLRWRAFRRRRDLTPLADRTGRIRPGDILLATTLRNEARILPWFLDYYRKLGVAHFLVVDNGSDDGSVELLARQDDVSLWQTRSSYREARFGMDWLNWILMRHATGHWVLTVDADEFLVYPFCDTRPLRALTDWLDDCRLRAYPAMLLDMYPDRPLGDVAYQPGEDPFRTACWFDGGNYMISVNPLYRNLWIQGGPRARVMFPDRPEQAPSLNKIPLVRWRWPYCYASSTHMLLPCGLNLTYDDSGGEKPSGCLLHAKFVADYGRKVTEELERGEHFADSREYQAYADALHDRQMLWCEWSQKYVGWRQLELMGLMSKGSWA